MSQETDRIEADLNESRHRLNDTLGALGNKLSPGQMLDEALGLAQGQAGQFANNLSRQLRDNPLPSVLVAAGIAMYLMNQNKPAKPTTASWAAEDWEADSKYRSIEQARWQTQRLESESEDAFSTRLHDAYAKALNVTQSAGEAAHDFKRRVGETVKSLEHKASQARHKVMQTFSNAAHTVADKAGDAKNAATHLYADNPLAGGAIAVALGAIVGALAPLSDSERSALGGLAEKASAVGADMAERGARVAERPVH